MADFFNKDVPISNSDADGNYSWLRVKAGANESCIKQLKTLTPVNTNGLFLYNTGAETYGGSIYKYNNTLPCEPPKNPTDLLRIIAFPANANRELLNVRTNNSFGFAEQLGANLATLSIINSTSPIFPGPPGETIINPRIYLRVVMKGNTSISGDTIRLGIVDARLAGFIPGMTKDCIVNSVNEDYEEFVVTSGNTVYNFAVEVRGGVDNSVTPFFINLTDPSRGIIVKDFQFILISTPPQ